jgi:hypothetical protein
MNVNAQLSEYLTSNLNIVLIRIFTYLSVYHLVRCTSMSIYKTLFVLVRMIQWIGLSNKDIVERFKQTIDVIELPMKMEEYLLPKFLGNLVIVGDLISEVVAHEVALLKSPKHATFRLGVLV